MPSTNSRVSLLLGTVFIVVLAATKVQAHDPGLSYLELRTQGDRVAVSLSFASRDIEPLCPTDLDHNGEISEAEFDSVRTRLEQLARDTTIVEVDGKGLKPTKVQATHEPESSSFLFELSFDTSASSKMKVTSSVLSSLPRGHRQYASLRNDQGELITESMLEASNNVLSVAALGSREESSAFIRFVGLGIEHILTGYDHLAFLFALLIAGSCLRDAAKIITSFTLGHSISLALATFDLLRLPGTVVEPLIAASIVYVGVENLIRRKFNRRWALTFGFGLVHGLGFATVLRELGIGTTLKGALVPLLSFNTGVEIGQIVIAALVLPLIWKLRRNETFVLKYVPACSIVFALLGGYWFIHRTLL